MARPRREHLVVHLPSASAAADAALMAALREHGPVVGRLAPRLALVEVDPFDEGLAAVAGVVAAFEAEPPAALRQDLTETERLFVDAWLARSRPTGPPVGDGLPWDADPSRLPPDPPTPPPGPPWPHQGRHDHQAGQEPPEDPVPSPNTA